MTKETKIGLLVGLAFIVLFAIILSEKGTPSRDGRAPQFTLADSSRSGGPATEQPLGDKGRLPVDAHLAPIIAPSAKEPPATFLPAAEVPIEGPTIEEEPLADFPEELVNSLNSTPLPELHDDTPAVLPPGLAGIEQPVPIHNPPAAESGRPVRESAIKLPESLAAATPTAAPAPKPVKSEPSKEELERIRKQVEIKVRTVHEVEPGESLSKIAAKYYGRSTPERVDEIFNANREVLKSPSSVRARDKLRIPDLGEAFESAPDFVFSGENKTISPVRPAEQPLRIPIPVAEQSGGRKPALTLVPATASPGLAAARETPRTSSGRRGAPVSDARENANPAEAMSLVKLSPGAAKPEAKAKKKPVEDAVAFVWYEVKKSDTLSKIAKRELGSERQTGALFKMNQDIIDDRDSIRVGMKIRVPARIEGSSAVPSAVTTRVLDEVDD